MRPPCPARPRRQDRHGPDRQFSGGTELKNYWFAGFVPAEQPRYTIVVLQDTQAEPAFSSAAIFARVAAGLEILAP